MFDLNRMNVVLNRMDRLLTNLIKLYVLELSARTYHLHVDII